MLDVTIHADRVQIGRHFSVGFERTLRIPDDGRDYPLPPSLGRFPVRRVADYADRVPAEVARARRRAAADVPARGDVAELQRRALAAERGQGRDRQGQRDLGRAVPPAPRRAHARTTSSCRGQPWLDGINAGNGFIRQFVAMPLGMGYTVEGQVTGEERHGGLQIVCFDPKPGRFPDQPPPARRRRACAPDGLRRRGRRPRPAPRRPAPRWACGAAAGCASTSIRTRTASTPGTRHNYGRVFVHIVNSQLWREITGEAVAADPGRRARLHERRPARGSSSTTTSSGTSPPRDVLANVKSVAQKDAQHGFTGQQDDTPLPTPNVKPLGELGARREVVTYFSGSGPRRAGRATPRGTRRSASR